MKRAGKIYHFFIVLPDRLYPFANQVQGQWVRGLRSADAELRRAARRYGVGAYGYKLASYRQLFHLAGSLFVMYVATLVALDMVGSRAALLVLLTIATLFITYQEFYLQPRIYKQHWVKGVADWLVWCIPMLAYVFFR